MFKLGEDHLPIHANLPGPYLFASFIAMFLCTHSCRYLRMSKLVGLLCGFGSTQEEAKGCRTLVTWEKSALMSLKSLQILLEWKKSSSVRVAPQRGEKEGEEEMLAGSYLTSMAP